MRAMPRLLAVLLLAACTTSVGAQETVPASSSPVVTGTNVTSAAECTSYTLCALRVEPSTHGRHIVRGAARTRAAGLGPLRPAELMQLFATSDSSSIHAARFIRAERKNRLLSLGGIIAGAVGLSAERRMNLLTAAGAVMLVTSVPFQMEAERGLNNAVWWYNEGLARTTPR